MKTRNILAAIFAMATLVACNNDDNPNGKDILNGKMQELRLKLDLQSVSGSRAIEDVVPDATAQSINDIKLYFYSDAGTTLVSTHDILAADIATATSSTGLVLKISDAITYVKMKANLTTAGGGGDPDVATNTLDKFQKLMTGTAADFTKRVPLYSTIVSEGAGKINKANTPNNTVTLAAMAELGRIEVIGKIAAADVAKYGYDYVNATIVGISTIRTTKAAVTYDKVTVDANVGNGTWNTAYFDNIANPENGIATGKASAFQIFAPEKTTLPHLIVKVTKKKTNETTPTVGWITVTKYKDSGTKANITQFDGSKIYQVNLKDFADFFKGDPTTPDPESELQDLTVKVTVTDWTVVPVLPEL